MESVVCDAKTLSPESAQSLRSDVAGQTGVEKVGHRVVLSVRDIALQPRERE